MPFVTAHSTSHVAGIEDFQLHVFQVPIHDKVVGQYPHHLVFVVCHAEEAISEPGVEVIGLDRVPRAQHAGGVDLFDLVAVSLPGLR